jgi:hypothetical protein
VTPAPNIMAAIERLPNTTQSFAITTAIAGFTAARTSGDPTSITGAARLLHSEIGMSGLSPDDKASLRATMSTPIAKPMVRPATPAASRPVVHRPAAVTPPAIVRQPPHKPTPATADGQDVLALIAAVGLRGFRQPDIAERGSRHPAAPSRDDGGDVLAMIASVGLRGFTTAEARA